MLHRLSAHDSSRHNILHGRLFTFTRYAEPSDRSSGPLVANLREFLLRGGPPAALPAGAVATVLARRSAKGARHDLPCGTDGRRGDLQRSRDDLGAEASCRRHSVPAFLCSAALALLAALRLLKHICDGPKGLGHHRTSLWG